MDELNIQIRDIFLIRKLQEIAIAWEVSISGLARDMLLNEIGRLEHDSETRVELFRIEQNPKVGESSLTGIRFNLSANLQRAFVISCGINRGKIKTTTLSLLFGMLSQPYCEATGFVKSKLSVDDLLLDLDARFKTDEFQRIDDTGYSMKTMHQFMSSEPNTSYPAEERSVFSMANELTNNELSTKTMLQAILRSSECSAGRYLMEKGLSYDDFNWL